MTYGLIVCVESLGIFLESIFAKVHAGRKLQDSLAAWVYSLSTLGEKPLPAKIEQ